MATHDDLDGINVSSGYVPGASIMEGVLVSSTFVMSVVTAVVGAAIAAVIALLLGPHALDGCRGRCGVPGRVRSRGLVRLPRHLVGGGELSAEVSGTQGRGAASLSSRGRPRSKTTSFPT